MKPISYLLKLSGVILILIFSICSNLPSHAQDNPNTITFDNKSGEPATVKLVGPTGQTVEVPQGESRTINVAAGKYYILVRYGSKADEYTYSKGDPFTVEQTATQYSAISITLHKVVDGNYPTHPTSSEEFNKAATFPTSITNRTTIKRRDNRLIEGKS
jgi:ABC-type Fe3+-hydroxamate transport system substrate-binding protein